MTSVHTVDSYTTACEIPDADTISDDEVFGEWDEEERAAYEAYQRRELAGADTEAADYRRHVREMLTNTGLDTREVLNDPAIPTAEAERLAVIAGINPHNIGERPAKPAPYTTGVERSTAALLRAGTVNTLPKPPAGGGLVRRSKRVERALREAEALRRDAGAGRAEVECNAAAPLGDLAPITTDRDALAEWARNYCRSLCDRFQSVKLQAKLFGNPLSGSAGSLAWQISMMPDDDTKLAAWAAGARLSFDKKVGA